MKLTKQDELVIEHCLKAGLPHDDIIKLLLANDRGSRTSIWVRITRFNRTGTVIPKVGGRPSKLEKQHRDFILDVLEAHSEYKSTELQTELIGKFSLWVAEATIQRLFKDEEFIVQRAARTVAHAEPT
ncbi:unnamed protein product [Zymoseptoria tritici ST99CH_3D1]|nr:unnamed protein product [Zymoseptoria tritici ST99CH_3D1]